MSSARRLLGIIDSFNSEVAGSGSDPPTAPASPARSKSKFFKLSVLFGLKRTKSNGSFRRGTHSLDICLESEQRRRDAMSGATASKETADPNPLRCPETRCEPRLESRVRAFLGFRMSDGSALAPTRRSAEEPLYGSPSRLRPQAEPPAQPLRRPAAPTLPVAFDSLDGDIGSPQCSIAISARTSASSKAIQSNGGEAKVRSPGGGHDRLSLDSAAPTRGSEAACEFGSADDGDDDSGCNGYDDDGCAAAVDDSPSPGSPAARAALPYAAVGAAAAAQHPQVCGETRGGGAAHAVSAAPKTLRERLLSGGSRHADPLAPVAAVVNITSMSSSPAGRPAPRPPGATTAAFVPAPAAAPHTQLLATSAATPDAMLRSCWCLEDYAVDRRLYRSSMSSVYAAVCRRSGLPVALKVYTLARVPTNVVHMVIREVKIHSMLAHKNIVKLYGAFQDWPSQRLVLVQELAGNGDLVGLHRALRCRMSDAQVRALVLRPLLEALANVHSLGIVHRDIKPDNILFSSDWRLLLADFGVAIDCTAERAVTRAGTEGYMAPEVERCPLKMLPEENKDKDDLAYTTAADIWGVGCLAYQLLLGFPPYVNGQPATSISGDSHHCDDPSSNDDSGAADGGGPYHRRHGDADTRPLIFPASTHRLARDFISLALAKMPEDRPTARQLLSHPWLQQQ